MKTTEIWGAVPERRSGLRLGQAWASSGSGLVFGVQVEFLHDFAGTHSPVVGSLGLLLGAANRFAGAVGADKPKGRTELSERGTCPATTQPSSVVSARDCASKQCVLRVINSVIRRDRVQHLRDRDSVNAPDRRCVAISIPGKCDHPAEKAFAPKRCGDDSGFDANGFPPTQGFR